MTERPVHPYVVLAICCMSLLLVSMDATIVNVALPAIRTSLKTETADLQWVVDAYTLVVASLLMLGGSLADRYGRRLVFQFGLVTFTVASGLCSLAPDLPSLVAFRMLQAVGASMLNPVAMSIIVNTFVEPRARAQAIGVWGAVVGISMALGPLAGGGLTQLVGWRSIFWINLPVGAAAVWLARHYVPESKAPRARRIDPVGQALVLVGLASLTYAVIEGRRRGWGTPLITGLFAVAALCVIGVLVYEPRRREPLLDLRFFRSIPFASATVIAVSVFGSFSGFGFLNALYLQEVRNLTPLETGLYTLPLALFTTICAPISGRLVGSRGTRPSLLMAGSAIAASAFLLMRIDAHTPLSTVVISYVFFGIGFGFVNAPITNTAVSGMPRAQSGLAAAVASTSRLVGVSLGVAISGMFVGGPRTEFVAGMHAFFVLVAAAGVLVVVLGLVSSTRWARASAATAALLLDEK